MLFCVWRIGDMLQRFCRFGESVADFTQQNRKGLVVFLIGVGHQSHTSFLLIFFDTAGYEVNYFSPGYSQNNYKLLIVN